MDAGYLSIRTALFLAMWLYTVYAWMNVASKGGSDSGLHMNLYNPAATFSRLRCLHKLGKRLSERDRKKGEGGNDEGRKGERQLTKTGGRRDGEHRA